jgi:hypothetical protein
VAREITAVGAQEAQLGEAALLSGRIIGCHSCRISFLSIKDRRCENGARDERHLAMKSLQQFDCCIRPYTHIDCARSH